MKMRKLPVGQLKIQTRISLSFALTVATVLALFSLLIFYFSNNYRKDQFYSRLKEKAVTTANLLIEVEQVDSLLLKIIYDADQTILYQEKVVIFNEQYEKVFDSRPDLPFSFDSLLFEKIKMNNEYFFSLGGTEIIGTLHENRGNSYILIAMAYDLYGYGKMGNLRNVLMMGFMAALIIIFFLGRLFARESLTPISEVISQVDRITPSNLNVRVDGGGRDDEIDRLAMAFNNLLERLEKAFKQQNSFVAHASHELRNPFTAIIGQIDVALMSKRDEKEYQTILQSIRDDMKGLTSLTNRLLLLAKVYNEIPDFSFSSCRIDEVLFLARTELVNAYPRFQVSIDFCNEPDDEDDLLVEGNSQLLKTAFLNLMENGCKFSEKSEVRVELAFENAKKIVRFIDKGMGIQPEDQQWVYEPFFRSESAMGVKGHGIGLSLVMNIVKIHHASLNLHSEPKKGSTFEIVFDV